MRLHRTLGNSARLSFAYVPEVPGQKRGLKTFAPRSAREFGASEQAFAAGAAEVMMEPLRLKRGRYAQSGWLPDVE